MTDSLHWLASGILEHFFVSTLSIVVSTQRLVWIAINTFTAVVFPIKFGLISTKIHTIAIVCPFLDNSAACWTGPGHGNHALRILVNIGSVFSCKETGAGYFCFT